MSRPQRFKLWATLVATGSVMTILVVWKMREDAVSPGRAAQTFLQAVNQRDWKGLYAQFSAAELQSSGISEDAFIKMCIVVMKDSNLEPLHMTQEHEQPEVAMHRIWSVSGPIQHVVKVYKTPAGWKPYSGETILWLHYMARGSKGNRRPGLEHAMAAANVSEVIIFPHHKINFSSLQALKAGAASDPYLPWSPANATVR